MADSDDDRPRHTAADYYGSFLEELLEIIADGEAAGMTPAATDLLRRAYGRFRLEFEQRYPSAGFKPPLEPPAASDSAAGDPVPWHVVAAIVDDALASEADVDAIELLNQAERLIRPRV